ncbi:MAG: hypothetical protein LGR52_15920 [Candidatus Thiosymbion ectosymbiont of Robbea hypermnestra]|nr:hypothetical protein [Candidatus Thiosymbion ectosymbiont of Robbea hypermnestra]
MQAKAFSRELYYYSAHGLCIASELVCPELKSRQPPQSEPDVTICFGHLSDQLPDCVYDDGFSQVKPGVYFLKLAGIARFLVSSGKNIIIQPDDCPHEIIRLYLLSQGFGALLHQRGQLILHSSAIHTQKGAILFLGSSGSGKSTLVAQFLRRKYSILTDDLCTIGFSDSTAPQVLPGFAQIRLCRDAIEHLGYDVRAMQRIWHKEDKYTLILSEELIHRAIPLHAIYLLSPSDVSEVLIESLSPGEQFELLVDNIFRAEYVKGLGIQENVFRQITNILNHRQLKRVRRPKSHFSMDQLSRRIEEDFNAQR